MSERHQRGPAPAFAAVHSVAEVHTALASLTPGAWDCFSSHRTDKKDNPLVTLKRTGAASGIASGVLILCLVGGLERAAVDEILIAAGGTKTEKTWNPR